MEGGLIRLALTLMTFFGGAALLYVTVVSFTRDLWLLMVFVREERKRLMRRVGGPVALLLLATGVWTFHAFPKAALFPLIAIGPWLTMRLVAQFAWWFDDEETRAAALNIRAAEALRLDERSPTLSQHLPWPDYIFDVARARRTALYEPPPI